MRGSVNNRSATVMRTNFTFTFSKDLFWHHPRTIHGDNESFLSIRCCSCWPAHSDRYRIHFRIITLYQLGRRTLLFPIFVSTFASHYPSAAELATRLIQMKTQQGERFTPSQFQLYEAPPRCSRDDNNVIEDSSIQRTPPQSEQTKTIIFYQLSNFMLIIFFRIAWNLVFPVCWLW